MNGDEIIRAGANGERRLPVRAARSVDDIRPGEILLVDRRGKVISPRSLRRRKIVLAGLVVLEAACGYTLAGPIGLGVLGGVAAAVVWFSLGGWLRGVGRAQTLTSLGRLDEAEALLGDLERRRLLPRRARASVERIIADLARRRGDLIEAERRLDAALAICGRRGVARLIRTTIRFRQIDLFAMTGRADDATRLRPELDRARGEVFDAYRRTSDLFIAFARASTDALPDDPHEWARQLLSANTSGPELVALSWAYDARGDRDMAEHLLAEAPSRMGTLDLARSHPPLGAWMDEKLAAWSISPDGADDADDA